MDNDGDITVDEVERAYVEWAAAYDAGLIQMDYEDWMKKFLNAAPRIDLYGRAASYEIASSLRCAVTRITGRF